MKWEKILKDIENNVVSLEELAAERNISVRVLLRQMYDKKLKPYYTYKDCELDKDRDKIEKLVHSGYTENEICKVIKKSKNAFEEYCKENSISIEEMHRVEKLITKGREFFIKGMWGRRISREIRKEYSIGLMAIYSIIDRFEIRKEMDLVRCNAIKTNIEKSGSNVITEQDLYEWYIMDGMSIDIIAGAVGMSANKIANLLKVYGIRKVDERTLVDKDELKRLYVDEKRDDEYMRNYFGVKMGLSAYARSLGFIRTERKIDGKERLDEKCKEIESLFLSGVSRADIAKKTGYKDSDISSIIRKFDLVAKKKAHDSGIEYKYNRDKYKVDRQTLIRELVINEKSTKELAEELGIQKHQVELCVKFFRLKIQELRREYDKNLKQRIRNMYDRGYSNIEISEKTSRSLREIEREVGKYITEKEEREKDRIREYYRVKDEKKVRELLKDKNLSRKEIAQMTGNNQEAVSKVAAQGYDMVITDRKRNKKVIQVNNREKGEILKEIQAGKGVKEIARRHNCWCRDIRNIGKEKGLIVRETEEKSILEAGYQKIARKELEYLYKEKGYPMCDIAAMYSVTVNNVRNEINRYGMGINRNDWVRHKEWLDKDDLELAKELGVSLQNVRDRKAKYGARDNTHKVTEKEVNKIERMINKGKYVEEIAKDTGVCTSTVDRVVSRLKGEEKKKRIINKKVKLGERINEVSTEKRDDNRLVGRAYVKNEGYKKVRLQIDKKGISNKIGIK